LFLQGKFGKYVEVMYAGEEEEALTMRGRMHGRVR